jgi:hypothetical protein
MGNQDIADKLDEVAELIERQGGNVYRARSYRRAAGSVRAAEGPLAEAFEWDGVEALERLPGVGERMAGAIGELIETGRLGLLERLRAESSPERVLAEVPGVGPKLAARIHERLGVERLEQLEQAAHDGRLAEVESIGAARVECIRGVLAGMLSRSARKRSRQRSRRAADPSEPESGGESPTVAELLDADAEYRRKAEADRLRRIAPRRFNPDARAWLPILETRRGRWELTLLYSNTARAHELGKTGDWVVVYYEGDGREGQHTVVTAASGPLEGRRVVRGREAECRRHYREQGPG